MNKRNSNLVPKSHGVERRLQILIFLCIAAFSILSFRLWTIQVYQHDLYKEKAKYNYVRQVPIKAERGMILDRNGSILARDETFCDIWVPIKTAHGRKAVTPDIQRSLVMLSEILETPEDRLERTYLNSPRDLYYKHARVRVAKRVSYEKYVTITERLIEFPEEAMVFPEKVTTRFYPKQDLAAHVLGRNGEIDKVELQSEKFKDYASGDWIGKSGVEKQYESYLRGVDGVMEVTVDKHEIQRGEPKIVKPPQPGKNVVLNLDYDLQLVAEQVLGVSRGVVIVSTAKDNRILALATNPRFNPNHYIRDFGKNYFDPEKPLYHRAISGRYPPGSVFKIFELFPLLEELKLEANHTEYCPGLFIYPGSEKPWKCDKEEGHGSVSLIDAVCLSCNVFFYKTVEKLGINRLYYWMDKFEFNDKTGIDLPGEEAVPFPSPKTISPWFAGYTINMAIGQGDIHLTPIQIHTAAVAIANGGYFYRPQVVNRILEEGERSPEGKALVEFAPQMFADPIQASTKTWEIVRRGMWEVVNNPRGTGRRVKRNDFVLSGKTGTAQNPGGLPHGWFVCFGPFDKPEVVITVLVENCGHGGEMASPLASRVLDVYLQDREELIASLNEESGPAPKGGGS